MKLGGESRLRDIKEFTTNQKFSVVVEFRISNINLNTYFNTYFNMARRKTENENIRKLAKIGDKSIGLTLPIEMIRKLNWREKQKVVVKMKGKSIIIRDWK